MTLDQLDQDTSKKRVKLDKDGDPIYTVSSKVDRSITIPGDLFECLEGGKVVYKTITDDGRVVRVEDLYNDY